MHCALRGRNRRCRALRDIRARRQAGRAGARAVFSLRELDARGAKTVFARCPAQEGVAMAVYNRLLRAAAFRVVEV